MWPLPPSLWPEIPVAAGLSLLCDSGRATWDGRRNLSRHPDKVIQGGAGRHGSRLPPRFGRSRKGIPLRDLSRPEVAPLS